MSYIRISAKSAAHLKILTSCNLRRDFTAHRVESQQVSYLTPVSKLDTCAAACVAAQHCSTTKVDLLPRNPKSSIVLFGVRVNSIQQMCGVPLGNVFNESIYFC